MNDFIFRDCRLGEHPKVRAHVCWLDGGRLVVCETAPPSIAAPIQLPLEYGVVGYALKTNQAMVISDVGARDVVSLPFSPLQSELAVPIAIAKQILGVLGLESTDIGFFSDADIGRSQLLGALLAYSRFRHVRGEAAIELGRALSAVRTELGLTQDELAYRGGLNRMAISQWERGRWPPSLGPIYRWCAALGLVADAAAPQVSFLDVTPQFLVLLRDNPAELHNLSPERFEHVVAERIDRMGYDVQLTGRTNRRDGVLT